MAIKKKPKMAFWVTRGEKKSAPVVDADKFGNHGYDHPQYGTSDCAHDCGCWMGPSASGGEVDPFGRCPKNPITLKQRIEELKAVILNKDSEIEMLKDESAYFQGQLCALNKDLI